MINDILKWKHFNNENKTSKAHKIRTGGIIKCCFSVLATSFYVYRIQVFSYQLLKMVFVVSKFEMIKFLCHLNEMGRNFKSKLFYNYFY